MLNNGALTVLPGLEGAPGYLVYSSDVDYLGKFVTGVVNGQKQPTLAESGDYLAIEAALKRLGMKETTSLRHFVRTDLAYETDYEMFRQGKMADSESLVGQILNWAMAPEDAGVKRKQRFDGSKLPEFAKVRQYLLPAGWYAVTEDNGWYVAGCLLAKEARNAQAPPAPPAR